MSSKSDPDVTIQLTGQAMTTKPGRFAPNRRTRSGGRRRGKHVRDVWEGQEYSADGTLVNKLRILDRDANHYKEYVQNADTGEVLRDVEERLSDHQGHGDAKPSRRNDLLTTRCSAP